MIIPLTMLFYTHKNLEAFKITITTISCRYLVMMLKFLYYEPHPYWNNPNIKLLNTFKKSTVGCDYQDFAMPSYSIFTSIIFNGQLMYCYGVKEYR